MHCTIIPLKEITLEDPFDLTNEWPTGNQVAELSLLKPERRHQAQGELQREISIGENPKRISSRYPFPGGGTYA